MTCRIVTWSAASREPAPLERAEPGETDRVEFDLTNDADCASEGVTITNAMWSIRTEDDDGNLVLSSPVQSGLVISTLAAVNAAATQGMYSILATVTLSDARVLHRWCTLPVVPITPTYA